MTSVSSSGWLSLQRCASYDEAAVRSALVDLLRPWGGLAAFVKSGQQVFLKPNLLSSRDPDAAVTTHPMIVETVSRMCAELGAKVVIGDSPPVAIGRMEEFWQRTGMQAAADRSGARLIALEREPRRELSLTVNGRPVRIHVTEWFFRADVVINLPKMKTHNLTRITGAEKNLYGLLPGVQKAQLHLQFPKSREFSRFVVALAAALPPHLSIMDGIVAMEGSGPAGGRPRRMSCLLAAVDPALIDMGFCRLIGLDPGSVPTLADRLADPLHAEQLSRLQWFGDTLEPLQQLDFQTPRASPLWELLPGALFPLARRLVWANPAIDPNRCVGCGICAGICPAGAIHREGRVFRIERKKCISCFCCMEVCPHDVIGMKTSDLVAFARWVRKWKRRWQGKPE